MASETAVVMLTLVGIGIIVVGAMFLMQRQRSRPIEIENKREVVIRSPQLVPPPSWVLDRGYSHWPVRPILL